MLQGGQEDPAAEASSEPYYITIMIMIMMMIIIIMIIIIISVIIITSIMSISYYCVSTLVWIYAGCVAYDMAYVLIAVVLNMCGCCYYVCWFLLKPLM